MSLLTPSLSYDDLADCDLVIEAVFENMDVKKDVFTKLDGIVKQGAILASNTSYLNIDEIAAVTKRPEYVLGLHFFSPANIMKLLEIVRGEKTADDVLMTAMKLSKKIGKGRGCIRRLPRLYRQPDAQPAPGTGEYHDHGRRELLGSRRRLARIRISDGAVSDVRSRRC